MKLYYFDVLNPRKACAVARHLNAPVEFVRVDLGKGEHKTPQYLAINPNGKVPALTDGARKLWESNAIMCYLARRAESDLWPRRQDGQIEVMHWFSWNAEHFSRHAGGLYFQYIVKGRFNIGPVDKTAVQEASDRFKTFAAVLNDHLNGRKYLLGDTLTVADFAVGVALPYATYCRIPLDGFTHIQRWHDRLNGLPAWREPFPRHEAAAA